MFNLLLITVPLALVLAPVYIIPAILGCLFWIFIGMIFVRLTPLLLKVWRWHPFAEFMGERLCVIERDVTFYAPIKGSIWKAIKQRSGVALEMMPLPLFGVFVLTAILFKWTGSIEGLASSVYFFIILGTAPLYTSFMALIRILKDSNLVYINPKNLRVQIVGDIFEKPLTHIGLIGSLVAVFQIVVAFSPSLASAWATFVFVVPFITGLVLAYMFLTAFVYLGFHPKLVVKLNEALGKSDLPTYTMEKGKGFMALIPPKTHLMEDEQTIQDGSA